MTEAPAAAVAVKRPRERLPRAARRKARCHLRGLGRSDGPELLLRQRLGARQYACDDCDCRCEHCRQLRRQRRRRHAHVAWVAVVGDKDVGVGGVAAAHVFAEAAHDARRYGGAP